MLNSLSLRKVPLHVSSVADFLLQLYLIAKPTHMLWLRWLVFHIQIHCTNGSVGMNGSVTAGVPLVVPMVVKVTVVPRNSPMWS